MKKILLLSIIIMVLCTQGFCETKTIVRETKGHGVDRDEAIKSALYQAVGEAKGVKVISKDFEYGFESATVGVDKEGPRKEVEFDAVSIYREDSALRTDIEGLVKTYEVLDEKKLDDGKYEVKLKVWVYDYVPPDKTDRVRLAVMPVKTLARVYHFGDLTLSPAELSRQLSHKLSMAFAETNKFALLDRENIYEFAKERGILLSDDSSLEEKARLGQVLGVDYMLIGTISEAEVRKEMKRLEAVGRSTTELEAEFTFDYRLVVGPSRQLKFLDTIEISLEHEEVKKLVKKWDADDIDYKEITSRLLSRVAERVVEVVIDRVYPIRIAIVAEDGRIVINQGGQRIKEGQIFRVYTEGPEIIDPDTKESLGTTETLVATIKVDKVSQKISYASVIKGNAEKLSEGMVCRPVRLEWKEPLRGTKKSNIKRGSRGGVKLPFDR